MQVLTFSHDQLSYEISDRIADAIESSRKILDLQDNWDQEGSKGYAESTWRRATEFVIRTAIEYENNSDSWVDPPKITPGPESSIDVRWKTSKRSILMNFPPEDDKPVEFFGSDGNIDSIKGTLDTSSQNQWILMWLIR